MAKRTPIEPKMTLPGAMGEPPVMVRNVTAKSKQPVVLTPGEARANLVRFGRQHAGVHRALNVHQRWVK